MKYPDSRMRSKNVGILNIIFMSEHNKLLLGVAGVAVTVSSIFGAGAGFLVTTNLPSNIVDTIDSRTIQVQEDSAVTQAVKKVNPAVVNVVVTKDLPKLEQYYYNPFGGDDFFNEFFGEQFLVPGQRQNGTERREVGGGSGFIVSSDGLVVTCGDVPSVKMTVTLSEVNPVACAVNETAPMEDLFIVAANVPSASVPPNCGETVTPSPP